ncbi:putative universal stress protein, Usp protein [Bradyrhizobium oligotrophicum S58]|uniref:Putative universal stress protein, Usp protein n=1 Tax=Bradyrhizobium oligotrophicum S58 TaxID=1245469 RepID=M4Z841_9BRAD|nr:universal stress protein [Bradyrhizobium oligotrophicum]BAM89301.1 putative universal stress protein, Usp protein [Bradyrhizobium oligotrophicum S58]
MYTHILLPTDGSDLSKAAIRHGIALAKATGAKVTALVVSTPLHSLVVDPHAATKALEQYKMLVADQTAKYLDHVKDDAERAGVACVTVCVEHDKPYEAIVETARDKNCDLVLMASHGLRGVSAILGSETLKVLTHSTVPILVYR